MRKKGLPVWVWILSLILIVYIIYIIYLLYPYLKMFLDNKYVIEPNDLPSYKDVFNSIFLVAQIIITSILTFLLYRTAENQRIQSYEVNNTKIASYLFYELKFSLVGIITSFYVNNIDRVVDEEVTISDKKLKKLVKKSGLELIKDLSAFRKFPIKDYEKLKVNFTEITHLFGDRISERDLMDYYLLIIDLEKADLDNSNAFVYLLNDTCNSLLEKKVGSKVLYNEFYGFLFDNNFNILNNRFKKLFVRLEELKKNGY